MIDHQKDCRNFLLDKARILEGNQQTIQQRKAREKRNKANIFEDK